MEFSSPGFGYRFRDPFGSERIESNPLLDGDAQVSPKHFDALVERLPILRDIIIKAPWVPVSIAGVDSNEIRDLTPEDELTKEDS